MAAKKTDTKVTEEKGVSTQADVADALKGGALATSPASGGGLRGGADGAADPWKIMEPVTVPRLQNSRSQPDFAVSVNGRIFKIQRGVRDVMVPRPIAQVVRRSLQATEDAADAYYAASGIKEV